MNFHIIVFLYICSFHDIAEILLSTNQAINQSINQLYILEGGVVGTCGALCNALAQKTGSQALGAVCDILCDIVGIEEFIKLVQK